jgi:sugar phosphate isomerase/epimerase
MTIYISTGGYKSKPADQTVKDLLSSGVKEIELSGGVYHPNLMDNLTKFLKNGVNFQIHNYFPPPKKPFIINLASNIQSIRETSLEHVFNAIKCCKKLNAKFYSFHAGFLCDFDVSEIGKKIKKRDLYDRKKSTDLFLECLLKISKFAFDHGVNIMVENNVVSKKNLLEFEKNPFLMGDPDETLKIMQNSPNNIKLLVDVAHLKVSANSLNYKSEDLFLKCNDYISGYHLSDNNGLADTNDNINEQSWFWKYLKKDLDYYSLEIYGETVENLKKIKTLCQDKLK